MSRSAAAASSRISRHSSASIKADLDQLPGGLPGDGRCVDRANAPGAARQHHDLLAKPHRLGEIVRDIDRGGAGALDQRGELVEQQPARLRIERRQRLVHQ
jgi:hypothetical protein